MKVFSFPFLMNRKEVSVKEENIILANYYSGDVAWLFQLIKVNLLSNFEVMVIGLSFNLNSNCLTYISQETRVENLLAKLYQEHALEMEGCTLHEDQNIFVFFCVPFKYRYVAESFVLLQYLGKENMLTLEIKLFHPLFWG
jgi:hypothetical protein